MKLILCIVVEDTLTWFAALKEAYPSFMDGSEALVVAGHRFELDICHQDDRIPEAFRYAACRLHPSFDDRDFEALAGHGAVIYAVSEEYQTDDSAFATAQNALTIAAVAADTGALGIKVESSGLAHHPQHWIALQRQVSEAMQERREGSVEAATTLFSTMIEAFVRMPIQTGETLHTCGMHHLGRPEVAVGGMDGPTAALWLQMFALYQTAEAPPDSFNDGQGFRLEADGERRVLRHKLDPGWYPADDLFHNAWGAWFLD